MDISSTSFANSFESSPITSLTFISQDVGDYGQLAALTTAQTKTFLLNPAMDEVQQISQVLARYSHLDSVNIVSHGDTGTLRLGKTLLNAETLQNFQQDLQNWSKALTEQGDILFYGCNVAQTEQGKSLLQNIAHLTQAEVAASTDLTGSRALGGNWDLEYRTGLIEATSPFQTAVENSYGSVLCMECENLVPLTSVTNTVIKNGSWFDPTIWQNGVIPTNGSRVYIPDGFTVTYDAESTARLQTLRVDGTLQFATDKNTKMLIDTFVVMETGHLFIGTQANPMQADKTANIIFTGGVSIDDSRRQSTDPKKMGLGLVSDGQVRIYGADKLDYTSLQGDALKGSKELLLSLPSGATTPQGWKVGDRLVLGGTSYNSSGSNSNNSRYQDEVLTITAINGNRISFTNNDITSGDNTVLRFNHLRPSQFVNDYNLKLYVANTTRNVVFQSELGLATPIKERGHVMFMDNPDVVVENAGFYNLGRTDKTKAIDDTATNFNGTPGTGTNPRGRYALHFHHVGAGDINGTPAIAEGNAIVGSPGWGIVHHDSHLNLDHNVVFDVAGAGISAEAGTEIGSWTNNLVIKMTGDGNPGLDQSNMDRSLNFDHGFEGDGYMVYSAGTGLVNANNIAISVDGSAIEFMNNRAGIREFSQFPIASMPDNLKFLGQDGRTAVELKNLPLQQFSGLEAYNTRYGISPYKVFNNPDGQMTFSAPDESTGYEFRSVVRDFRLWGVFERGLWLSYTPLIDFINNPGYGLIAGTRGSISGISGNSDSISNLYQNVRIDGFSYAVHTPREGQSFAPVSVPWLGSRLVNSSFTNNGYAFSNQGGKQLPDGTEVFSDYFQIVNTTISTSTLTTNAAPTANFSTTSIGGYAVNFNAGSSFDSDVTSSSSLSNRAIVSYGWDFNNDGQIDKFGKEVDFLFNSAGSRSVTLTVWDGYGKTGTVTKTVNVASAPYVNAVLDSDFSKTSDFIRPGSNLYEGQGMVFSSAGADYAWLADSQWQRSNGKALLTNTTSGQSPLFGQVIRDESLHVGQQSFSIDVKNTEGNSTLNKVTVRVWGVNGQFAWNAQGPSRFSYLPMTSTKLLEQNVGGSTFDWKTFKWNVNLGSGYEYLLVQVTAQNFNTGGGDFLSLDNLKLDAPTPVVTNDLSYAVVTSASAIAEGNSGSQTVTFTVSRTGGIQNASSVAYSIGGTATSGSDYSNIGGTSGATGLTGTINFAANETSKTITLNVVGDTIVESNETIQVTLSNGTAPNGLATLTTPSATTTITNDDSTTATSESVFSSTSVPANPDTTDGSGSAGDYELGMVFQATRSGQIQAIRYYKSPSETGTHIGRIWSSTGQLLATVTFTNETASGWQQQTLSTPLTIAANTTYIVSVNANSYYADTINGFMNPIISGDLIASNGLYNPLPGVLPNQSWSNSNYYRDVLFAPL